MADSIEKSGRKIIQLREEAIYIKGTERQIDFAEKLINKFNNEMDELINECPEQYKNDWIKKKEKISMILQESYAGDVIHILNINEKTGKDYYIAFYSRLLPNADVASMRIKIEVLGGKKMGKIFDNKTELDKWIDERFPAPEEWTWEMHEPSQESIAEKLVEEGYDLDHLLADGHDYEINGHTNNGWAYRDEIAPEFIEELERQGRIRER